MKIKSGQRPRKVLFFPYYWYLHYEPFRRVIARLNQAGLDAYMVYMPCIPMDESAQFGLERMRQDECPAKKLSIHNVGLGSSNLLARMLRFIGLVLSRPRIEQFLRAERPDMIVVGSDLGNSYFRLLLDLCRCLHIQVLIMATVSSGPSPDKRPAVPALLRPVLRWFKLEQILFEGWVLGSYHREALLAVAGKEMKKQLIRDGVSQERIFVTGNPTYDLLYEIRQRPASEVKQEICTLLGWPMCCRLIVYCTERIQEVYGEDYLERLNRLMVPVFDDLPEECRVIVKLHPRECPVSSTMFATTFSGSRYRVVQDLDVHHLLRVAEVAIGHFSVVLVDAALLGTPLLRINIADDRSRMAFGPDVDLLYIYSETELREKLYGILYNQEFLDSVKSALSEWSTNYAVAVDGRSADRVACLIQSLVESQQCSKSTS